MDTTSINNSTNETSSKIKVLLVDDQPLVRMGFSMVLSAQDDIEVIAEANDGVTALQQVSQLLPDIVLMDVRMPNMNGIEATKEIVEKYPDTKVLVLTTFDIEEYAFAALRAGAGGFLSKDALPEELVQAIRSVAAGDATISPKITRKMLELFANKLPDENGEYSEDNTAEIGETTSNISATPSPECKKLLSELTAREIEVLKLVSHGYSNAEIAQELYVSTPTVKTHVSNILSKLNLRDRIQAVIFAYENGLTAK